jgi:hypothetical protein
MSFYGKATKEQIKERAKLGGQTSKLRSEQNKKLYYNNPKLCKQCGNIILYEKKNNNFCNRSCSATFNNLISNHPNGYKCEYETVGYEKPCEYCGKILKRSRKIKSTAHVFCCIKHQFLYLAEQKIKNKQPISSGALRRYLIYVRGHKCEGENCGLSIWMGKPIPLDVHHIDGDANNNDPENLKLLCKNCHGLTDNYGAKNIGNCTRKPYYKKRT